MPKAATIELAASIRALTWSSDVRGLDIKAHKPQHIINFPALICSPTVSEPSQLENREFRSTNKPQKLARKALIPISRLLSLARKAIFFARKALGVQAQAFDLCAQPFLLCAQGPTTPPASIRASPLKPFIPARKPQRFARKPKSFAHKHAQLGHPRKTLCAQASEPCEPSFLSHSPSEQNTPREAQTLRPLSSPADNSSSTSRARQSHSRCPRSL